jgi:hypothetical protein
MLHRVRDSFHHFFNRQPLTPNSIPVLIFGIALVAFSIKTLDQGFFHDDWHHVYYAKYFGAEGLKQFLFYDSRPLSFFVYAPLFSLLGFQAWHWHVLVLVLRFLTVWIFFIGLNLLWENHKKENGLVAALFLIYPVFQVQPNSVAYALHWVTYLAFMLSFLFMILAVRRTSHSLLFASLSILFEVFHLLMIEYFAGIELARPLLLWFAFRDIPSRERLRKVGRAWLPYFVILVLYAVFRASFSQLLGYDRNSPVILFGLFSDTWHSIIFLLQSSIRDLVDVLIAAWNPTYDPAAIDFSIFTNIWIWSFVAATIFIAWMFFSLVKEGEIPPEHDHMTWARTMLGLGLIFTILGLLPTWISGRTFFQLFNLFDDRLALPSMFGASMVWIGGIFYLIRKPAYGYLIVSILLGLAIGLQLRTNVDYARGWQKQSQFYWQLYWRAPYVQPGTAIISEGEIFPFMGVHPTSYAINLLYPPAGTARQFNYAFFASGERLGGWEEFRRGATLTDERFGSSFTGSSKDSLTIFYQPENQQCLWILRPQDSYLRNMPALTYESLPLSNLTRIQRAPLSDRYPSVDVFGAEPAHTWCFYYQKAELARQYGDWQTVTDLWKEAKQNNFLPGNGAELIVFVEGFANIQDWPTAAELTITSSKYGNNIRPALCDVWQDLKRNLPNSQEKEDAYQKVSEKLPCDAPGLN